MKNYKAIFFALLLGFSPAAWAQTSAGTNDLIATNISGALTAFSIAVANSPTDPTANVYLALTRLLALPNDPLAGSFLTDLGISSSGRNVYHWKAKPHKNGNGHLVLPTAFNPDEFTEELLTDVVPTLQASQANLAAITDQNFTLFLPGGVTHLADVTMDYGDAQMLRAILDAQSVFGYTVATWNLAAPYGGASNIIKNDKSIASLLNTYTDLLTITNPGNFALARGVFTNAINHYFVASQFIRNVRAPGVRRLFNLDTNEYATEANFRTTISNLENSLNGPVALKANKTNTINLGAFFSGNASVRSLLPTQAPTGANFIWDSFSDTTLGGVISGLTETNLGKVFLKLHEGAELNTPGVVYAIVGSGGNNSGGQLNGVVVMPSSAKTVNLFGTLSYGGNSGNGEFFEEPGGTSQPSYSYSFNGNSDGGGPSSLVLANDGYFYGTTQYGGDNGIGTVFRIAPGGKVNTLYSFGDNGNDNGVSGGNPLIQGSDGNFYGTSQNGGDGGAGAVFQFVLTSRVPGSGTVNARASFPNSPATFNGTPAAGALIQGSDGNFYGATQFGGNNYAGSIFQFILNGNQLNTLYSFPGPTLYDQYGNVLAAGITLAQGSNGLFYGTTQYGGNNYGNASGGNGDGSIFSIDTQGNFNTLYSFDEDNYHGFGPVGALVQGTNGAFYGATSSGGANEVGTLFKFTPGKNPDFLVWFNDNLGKEESEQNNNNNGGNYGNGYDFTLYAGLSKSGGVFYGTTPNGNNGGTVFSLTGNNPGTLPAILVPPASTNGLAGSSLTLTVTASSATGYQWRKNGTTSVDNVPGATSASLTFPSLTLANAGSYYVVVSDSDGSATSPAAVLTVLQGPIIAVQPAAAVTILQGAELSLFVKASGGSLGFQWQSNNVSLTDGGNIRGSATSNLVISPAVIANSATYTVVASNSVGPVTSHPSVVTVLADPNRPVVSITSPVNGARSNAPVTFSGSASELNSTKGNVLITGVNYFITNLNGAPLTTGQALLSAGVGSASNWLVSVSPPAGSNIFAVQSQDFSGNTSPSASLKFFLKSPAPFIVFTNTGTGTGSVKGAAFIAGDTVPANGALLNVGETYSITAAAGKGSYFVNWTGTAGTTNGATLTFVMTNGTTLTANFITNMFVQMAGTYNGLFSSDLPGITEETAGLIGNLKLTTNGGYTATVLLAGTAAGISGTFSHDGFATNPGVAIKADGNVKVELAVNAGSYPRTITGSVIGTNAILSNGVPALGWTSTAALVASLANTHALSGEYNLLIPPVNAGGVGAAPSLVSEAQISFTPVTPPGYGFALLTNNPGTSVIPPSVTLSGMLADGATLSQNVPIGEDFGIPVFENPYSNNTSGLLFGRLNLAGSPAPTGYLSWIRKKSTTGFFESGFTNTSLAVLGSPWSNSLPLDTIVLPNSQLVVSNNGVTTPLLTVDVAVNKTNLVPEITTPNFKTGFVNTNTGQFTILFTNGARTIVTNFGAVLQNANSGGGFFIQGPVAAPTNAGSVLLAAPSGPGN